jgi:V/A-type H+-transporting ATPase subunit I
MIVKMSRITMLGMEDQREALVKSLMDIGAVEISTSDDAGYDELAGKPDVQDELSGIENEISQLQAALASLDKYCPVKKKLFQTRREMTPEEFGRVIENKTKIWESVSAISGMEEQLVRLKTDENRIENLRASLVPWREYPIAFDITGTHRTVILLGTIPAGIDIDDTKKELEEKAPFSELTALNSDKDQYYIYVICYRDMEQDCMSYLKTRGFNKVVFQGLTGTAAENIERLDQKLKEISSERERLTEKLKSSGNFREDMEALYDWLMTERERSKANERFLVTKRTFLINGWIPSEIAERTKKDLEDKFTVTVEITEAGEDEETPVLLENSGIAEAGEPVLKMYSLPNSTEIDPSPVMSPFFVLLFGLMLGDGGYGLIMVLAAGMILRLVKLERDMRIFMKLMLYCGISTMFWGALFGSWFGIESLAKYGLWINPVQQPELMLSWSLLFGIIHLYAGFCVKAANLIRRKKYLDALFDVGFTLIFYTGFVLFLLPYAPEVDKTAAAPFVEIGKYMMGIGALLLMLTQGRASKKFIGKITGGLSSLYSVISFMSDILSYSRLLALGLATGIIASIVNQMSAMFPLPALIKIILMAAVLLIGHVINFAINALGAYVHSCRLQYLEFFGKFFTGGGRPFKPLKANTKYTQVKTEADM